MRIDDPQDKHDETQATVIPASPGWYLLEHMIDDTTGEVGIYRDHIIGWFFSGRMIDPITVEGHIDNNYSPYAIERPDGVIVVQATCTFTDEPDGLSAEEQCRQYLEKEVRRQEETAAKRLAKLKAERERRAKAAAESYLRTYLKPRNSPIRNNGGS